MYPAFRSPLQSDGTMTGLTALEILRGDLPVFLFHGTRLGALESYLHAVTFTLLGASRATLYLAPQLAGAALLAAFAALARALLGPRVGRLAFLLFAVPSPMVLLWIVLPFGYTLTLLFATTTLVLACRMARRGPEPLTVFVFGLAAGLGWWCSPSSLAGTLPAALWVVLHRPGLRQSLRAAALGVSGLVAGALPWIAINIRDPLVSFRGGTDWQSNFALRSAGGIDQFLDNAGRLADRVPELLLRADCARPAGLGPAVAVGGALYIAALVLALAALVSRRSWRGLKEHRVPAALLPVLVVAFTCVFFVVSAAGSVRGDTVRYVLPIGLAAPLLLAPLVSWIDARSRAAAATILLLILTVHVSGSCMAWTAGRAEMRHAAQAEDRLLALLADRGVAWVFGPYWDVYGLNFLTGEKLRAIPDHAPSDYHGYERVLGDAPSPLAVISREPGAVADWSRRAGLTGTMQSVDGVFEVFLPADNPPSDATPTRLVARLREAQVPEPLPPQAGRFRIDPLDVTPSPLHLRPGGRRDLRVRVTHLGREASWPSALGRPTARNAVRVGAQWVRDGLTVAQQRAEIPGPLRPGGTAEVWIELAARTADGRRLPAGRYAVRIGVLQELVRWFEAAGPPLQLDVEVR